jgi:HTH-like domain
VLFEGGNHIGMTPKAWSGPVVCSYTTQHTPHHPADPRQSPRDDRRKGLLTLGIPGDPRSGRNRQYRPVTPEIAGSSPAAAQGERRAQAREHDPEGRIGVFRDGARPDPAKVSRYVEERRDAFGRADLRGDRRARDHVLRAQVPKAVSSRAREPPARARGLLGARGLPLRPGVRKAWKELKRRGLEVGRDRVARLMRARKARGVRRGEKRRTTIADESALERAGDLVQRDFNAAAPRPAHTRAFRFPHREREARESRMHNRRSRPRQTLGSPSPARSPGSFPLLSQRRRSRPATSPRRP